MGGPTCPFNKSKMAATAIFNFEKNSITPDWIILWEDASRPSGDNHMTKTRNRKLIRVTITDIWTKFDIRLKLKYYTIKMTECAKFTLLENPRWRQPPTWISENVNNSELNRAICTKFGGRMHHDHAEMTHDQKSNRDNSRIMTCDVIKRMSGT